MTNTILALLFFFMGLFYLLDSYDLRTQKNKVLLLFFLSISGYHFTHYLYISLYSQEGVELLNTVVSVVTIVALTSILIYLFLFIVLDTDYPNQDLITKIIVGICVFFGFFSMLRYLICDRGRLILASVFQLFLTDIWFFSFFLLAESIIIFFVFVSLLQKYKDKFFPSIEKTLVRREYLHFFALAILLGGTGESIKAVGDTVDFLIVGGFLNTIGLAVTILILVITRKHLRNITWQIIEFQLEEMKELDEIKNQLMDFASHEIRTPLSIMWGNIELLHQYIEKGELTEEQRRKIFTAIERNYRRIEKLIDKSYDLSRLRRGLFELEKGKVDLWDLITHSVKNMEKFVEKNDLIIKFATKKQRAFVLIDPHRIHQVLRNLIENAVKYSDSGEIIVTLSDTKNGYIISVKDEGIGVLPENSKIIFELYKDKETPRIQEKGLGLGLYISRSIIELHQGKIWVESEGEGKGSTFSFLIPKEIEE
ncbi:MAG: ATP-binding protein [Promethearchaeota archaeon]